MGKGLKAREVKTGAPAGKPADQRDPFPIYTVLDGIGLSDADVLAVGDRILSIIRAKIKFKALNDDRGLHFRYINDANYRSLVNQEVTAEALMEIGFSSEELTRIRNGLRLSHTIGTTPEKKAQTAVAQSEGGQRTEYEFLKKPDKGKAGPTVLKNKSTGKVHTVNPDLT